MVLKAVDIASLTFKLIQDVWLVAPLDCVMTEYIKRDEDLRRRRNNECFTCLTHSWFVPFTLLSRES